MDDVFALAAAAKHMARTEPDVKHAAVRKLDLNGLDLENQRLGHPLLVEGNDAMDNEKNVAKAMRLKAEPLGPGKGDEILKELDGLRMNV